jgi:putative ABC transport system permease protein
LPSDPASPAARGLYPAPGYHVISDDYFRVLGLRLRAGRGFDMSDRDGSPPVVVLSERMARHLWKGENPIGQMLRIGQTGPLLTVIGVVSDVRTPTFGIRGLGTDPHPDLYLSERQATSASATLLVRARTDARALESSVTAAVRALDPEQAVVSVGTLAEEIALTTSVIRVLALIFAAFAGCALVLALIGIYGVISYSVAQRTRELGIRMALGATTPDVLRTVLRRGVQLTAVGLAIGLVAAVLLSRAMSGALRGLAPVSVATYAAATITFAAVALLAAYLPARRAARVDPMVALRER